MVYLHVPFCKSFCTYCAFYSELFKQSQVQDYVQAVLAEISSRKEEIAKTLSKNTLYIGGGTPSVLPPIFLSQIVKALAEITGGVYEEFTLEMNPDDVTPEYLAFLKSLGVTRVSMGVQSFDDEMLRHMARRHNAHGTRESYRLLREHGFDNISLDLIFGVGTWKDSSGRVITPVEQLLHDIDSLLTLPGGLPEHISAYQLSIEEGSALEKQLHEGRYQEADELSCEQSYLLICEKMREADYEHYEISNYARAGYRAVHNSAYWSGHPYVGLGPAAHSYDGAMRSWNPSSVDQYIQAGCSREYECLSEEQKQLERLMLSLRTQEGVEEAFLCQLSSKERVNRLLEASFLEKSSKMSNLHIPEKSWFVADHIISELI